LINLSNEDAPDNGVRPARDSAALKFKGNGGRVMPGVERRTLK
jgi:hypothetical protein